ATPPLPLLPPVKSPEARTCFLLPRLRYLLFKFPRPLCPSLSEPVIATDRTQKQNNMKRKNRLLHYGLSLLTAGAALFSAIAPAQAADKKPNIVIIWGDEIGQSDINAYTLGL